MSRLRRLVVSDGVFFITSNLLRTRSQFTEEEFVLFAKTIAEVRARRKFLLAGYVFMPDHWHALVVPGRGDTLPELLHAIKIASAHRLNRARRIRGNLWQSRYYDRVVRTVKEYHDTLNYMHLNPVTRGLVAKPDDWLWSSYHSCGGPAPVRLQIDRLNLPADENAFL